MIAGQPACLTRLLTTLALAAQSVATAGLRHVPNKPVKLLARRCPGWAAAALPLRLLAMRSPPCTVKLALPVPCLLLRSANSLEAGPAVFPHPSQLYNTLLFRSCLRPCFFQPNVMHAVVPV